jgi:hypothetical protein
MKRALLALSLLLLSIPTGISAHDVPPALSKVSEALDCLKKEGMPGWTRERVQPIDASKGVLVDVWVSGGRRVKVSILYYESEAAAVESMQRLASGGSAKKVLGLGDEAYSFGYGDDIALRKGNLTAFVSAISDIDVLLPALDSDEKSELRRVEQAALNKNFARILANVLTNPAAACVPNQRF